jgi:hypothetical protein
LKRELKEEVGGESIRAPVVVVQSNSDKDPAVFTKRTALTARRWIHTFRGRNNMNSQTTLTSKKATRICVVQQQTSAGCRLASPQSALLPTRLPGSHGVGWQCRHPDKSGGRFSNAVPSIRCALSTDANNRTEW